MVNLVTGKLGDDQRGQKVTFQFVMYFPAFSMDVCFDITLWNYSCGNFEFLLMMILAKTKRFLSQRVQYWPYDIQPNHTSIYPESIFMLGLPHPPLSTPVSLFLRLLRFLCVASVGSIEQSWGTPNLWRTEDNFWEQVLFFYLTGSHLFLLLLCCVSELWADSCLCFPRMLRVPGL